MSFLSRLKLAIKAFIDAFHDKDNASKENLNESILKEKIEPLVSRVEGKEFKTDLKKHDDSFEIKHEDQSVIDTQKKRPYKNIFEYMTPEEYSRYRYLNSYGLSVTGRVKMTKQPRGGYIRPRDMEKIFLGQNSNDGMDGLNPNENIPAGLIGLAVDYLTRFMIGEDVIEAFNISLIGAKIIQENENAMQLISKVKGLDKESAISALKLSGYDVVYRSSVLGYRPVDTINPNDETLENIITMVNRSLKFFEKYGPCVLSGFDLKGGYTTIIAKGDGDYLTSDTVWDFKVSKYSSNTSHTLQLLIYWRMGLHSVHQEFKNVKYLGIFNPRTNIVQRISVDRISPELIEKVEFEIIGYRPKDKMFYIDEEVLKRMSNRYFSDIGFEN